VTSPSNVLAEDLEAVRGDLGLERVAVLGHSINGVLAFEYARRCPATVSHVIAVGTSPFGDMATLVAKATPFFETDASEERKRILGENLAKLPPNAPPSEGLFAQTPLRFFDPRFDARPLFAESEVKPEFMAHLLGPLVRGWDVTAGASALGTPILVALGRYDYVVPYTLWDDVAPKLPDATVQIFERSGHQPFCEEPERFAAVLSAWLAR
jgi:proline iminopeptidase